jgi:hypothetical protein
VRSPIPAVAGWKSFSRSFLSLLAFGLAIVAGEWLVHQLEYLTEYGPRFGAVMGTTPHRLYMLPLGLVLGLTIGGLLVVATATLAVTRRALSRQVSRLPDRVARHVPVLTFRLSAGAVATTALVLAGCQTAVYVVQENLEWFAVTGQWRGLSVVLGVQHATLVPFQLLVATCGALILWTLSSLVRQSRHAVRLARALVAALARQGALILRCRTWEDWVLDLRLSITTASPRAPPLI